MRRIYKSMIWVSVLALSAGAVSAQKAERKNVREGNKLYESEKYTESEIAYRKSLEVNPRSTEGTYNLGNSLYKQGKFPGRRAISIDRRARGEDGGYAGREGTLVGGVS